MKKSSIKKVKKIEKEIFEVVADLKKAKKAKKIEHLEMAEKFLINLSAKIDSMASDLKSKKEKLMTFKEDAEVEQVIEEASEVGEPVAVLVEVEQANKEETPEEDKGEPEPSVEDVKSQAAKGEVKPKAKRKMKKAVVATRKRAKTAKK